MTEAYIIYKVDEGWAKRYRKVQDVRREDCSPVGVATSVDGVLECIKSNCIPEEVSLCENYPDRRGSIYLSTLTILHVKTAEFKVTKSAFKGLSHPSRELYYFVSSVPFWT